MNTSSGRTTLPQWLFLLITLICYPNLAAQVVASDEPGQDSSLDNQPVLGPVIIEPNLREQFRADIEFFPPMDVDIDDVSVRMATEQEFDANDIDYDDFVNSLDVSVVSSMDGDTIALRSERIPSNPLLQFPLVVNWLEHEMLIINMAYMPPSGDIEPSQEEAAQPETELSASTDEWIPPGFEDLNAPQITEVDLFLGGVYLGSTLVRYTNRELTFLDPETITEKLPDLLDPAEFNIMLEQPLATNGQLACRSDFQVDCGSLSPAEFGIIFNANDFTVTMFISGSLLRTTSAFESRFLPESTAGFSALNESSLRFTGSDSDITFNANNNSKIAIGQNRMLLRSNWTDTEGLLIDEVSLARDYRGLNYQLGLVRANSNNLRFMNSEQFLGFSTESSLITRTDLGQSQGTEIVLFFESRSRVEVYRDDRLIYSAYYDLGNRTLVTSDFPTGSYNIEIRITNSQGVTSTEERFYSKSARLAPVNETLFFFQAGSLITVGSGSFSPEPDNQILRGGISRRLFTSVNGSLGFSKNAFTELAELSLYRQGENLQASTSLVYESNGTTGVDLDLRYRSGDFSASIEARKIVNSDDFTLKENEVFRAQLRERSTQTNARVNYNSDYGQFGIFYRENYTEDLYSEPLDPTVPDFINTQESRETKNFGVRWDYSRFRIGNSRFRLGFEWSKNNGESLALFNLSYNFRKDRTSFSMSPRYRVTSDIDDVTSSELIGNANGSYRYGEQEQHQISLRATKQNTSIVEAAYVTEGFNTAADIRTSYDIDEERLAYTGNLKTSFATTTDALAFGSSQSKESAFLINVDSQSDEVSDYEVMINGRPSGITQSGRTLLVPVAPYDTYKVDVRSIGDRELINLQRTNYVETVYPGNVIALDWVAEVIKVAYGRIVDEGGLPIINAVISTPDSISFINSEGFFQIEINSTVERLTVRKGTENCRVDIQQDESAEVVMDLGILTCKPLAVARLSN